MKKPPFFAFTIGISLILILLALPPNKTFADTLEVYPKEYKLNHNYTIVFHGAPNQEVIVEQCEHPEDTGPRFAAASPCVSVGGSSLKTNGEGSISITALPTPHTTDIVVRTGDYSHILAQMKVHDADSGPNSLVLTLAVGVAALLIIMRLRKKAKRRVV